MDIGLIIVIAVAVLLLFFVARRGWARSIEARREKAGELRVESTRKEQSAREAEIQAEREREAAEASARRADRLDPDVDSGGGRRFSLFRRNRDEDEVTDDEVVEADSR